MLNASIIFDNQLPTIEERKPVNKVIKKPPVRHSMVASPNKPSATPDKVYGKQKASGKKMSKAHSSSAKPNSSKPTQATTYRGISSNSKQTKQ